MRLPISESDKLLLPPNGALPPGVAAVVDGVTVRVSGGVSRFDNGTELARVGKWGAVQQGDAFGWYGQGTPEGGGQSRAAVWPPDGATIEILTDYITAAGRLEDGRLVTAKPIGARWGVYFDGVLVESGLASAPLMRQGRCFARENATTWVEVTQ